MWRSHTCILRNTSEGSGTDPSPTITTSAGRRDELRKSQPTADLCCRRDSGARSSYIETKLEASPSLSSRTLFSHRCPKIQLQNGHCVLNRLSYQTQAEKILLPELWVKAELDPHKSTREPSYLTLALP